MRFIATPIEGARLIEPECHSDERGFFARTFCADEFAAEGLRHTFVQCNLSFNARRGTLRGLHFQAQPHEEAKVVSCPRGSIYDVLVDLRPSSATFMEWAAFELSRDNGRLLYIPEGVAHGFQSLADDSDVFYLMSDRYVPELARGIRWNDPAFRVRWPLPEAILSSRDASYPDFKR